MNKQPKIINPQNCVELQELSAGKAKEKKIGRGVPDEVMELMLWRLKKNELKQISRCNRRFYRLSVDTLLPIHRLLGRINAIIHYQEKGPEQLIKKKNDLKTHLRRFAGYTPVLFLVSALCLWGSVYFFKNLSQSNGESSGDGLCGGFFLFLFTVLLGYPLTMTFVLAAENKKIKRHEERLQKVQYLMSDIPVDLQDVCLEKVILEKLQNDIKGYITSVEKKSVDEGQKILPRHDLLKFLRERSFSEPVMRVVEHLLKNGAGFLEPRPEVCLSIQDDSAPDETTPLIRNGNS